MSPSDSDPAGPTGPYVAGGPVGQDGTLSLFISTMLARLAGILLLAMWAHLGRCPHLTVTSWPGWSVCCRAPVGPDGTLSPFVSNHAGPAGQHVAVGPVGPFGMLSPSDCHPAGPAGPYVAGGPVGSDGTLSPFTL